MGSKPRIQGVCPDQTCILWDKKKEVRSVAISDRELCKEIGSELGVSWRTIRTWLYRRNKVASIEANTKEEYPLELSKDSEYRIGDFREVLKDIPDESVDLILTDPPYGNDAINLFFDLGVFAKRVLKPGGSLFTYCGQSTIYEVTAVLKESLRYWWMLCLEHTGAGQQLPGKWVLVKWKPILWFVKDHRAGKKYVVDRLRGEEPKKEQHEWAQGVSEIRHIIEQLTSKGDLIIDPFAGTGKWGELAGRMGRRWIGCDLELGGGLNIS